MARLPKSRPKNTRTYDREAAAAFWTRRLGSTDPLAAVLTFDAPPAVNRAYDRWERELLKQVLPQSTSGKRALDIGCGIGRIAVELARLGAAVAAVDISPAMLAACRSRARRAGVASRISTVPGAAEDLPVAGAFDIITCFGLLEHLPPRIRGRCLGEAFRHLKARGRMYVVVNNQRNVLLSGRYSLTAQRPDGYYVGLVGLPWLQRHCRKHGLEVKVRGANPFYGLVHYHLLPHARKLRLSPRDIAQLCRLATTLDLANPLTGPVSDRFASHLLVEIKRTARRR